VAGGGILWVEVFTLPFANPLRIRVVCLGIGLSRNANVPIIASHPTGNANSRQAMQALAEAGLLAELHTSIATFQGNVLGRISGLPGFGELRRRTYPSSLQPFIRMHPWREAVRLASLRFGWTSLVERERGWASVERVYGGIDKCASRAVKGLKPDGVYSYEDGALETFRAAGNTGAKRLYDLPIGYWRAARRILQEEAERRPEWAVTLGGLQDSATKLSRKDEELRLADRILVASSFTKKTLEECPFPVAPIAVIPYGANDAFSAQDKVARSSADEPLRVLFVGGLSQRKGIADLFEAVELLKTHVELTVIGRKPTEACEALDVSLKKHRWVESMPRERILEEMQAHDVLVFPSLFEGFGLVVTEALSQGMPVITTPHTCGPDVITEGEDGFIVPIRDPQAITEKLELLHRDRDRLAAMSEAASKKAKSLTWERYRQGVVEVVRETLALKSA
jgi:glycosyltransferase involved in cell wall biosynthesis